MNVSVSEFKAKLSAYLRRVQDGARIVITDHGRPIVEVAAFGSASMSRDGQDALLRKLADSGAVRLPTAAARLAPWKRRPHLERAMLSDAVNEDRG